MFDSLFSIEFTIIGNDLAFFCDLVMVPGGNNGSTDTLLTSLLVTYNQSKQFDVLLTALLNTNSNTPKFSPTVNKIFIECVIGMNSQVVWSIMELLRNHITTKMEDSDVSFSTLLLCEMLTVIEISSGLVSKLDIFCEDLYSATVVETIQTTRNEYTNINLIHFLILFCVMAKCSNVFYNAHLSTTTLHVLSKSIQEFVDENESVEGAWREVVMYHLDRLYSTSVEASDMNYARELFTRTFGVRCESLVSIKNHLMAVRYIF